MADPILLICAPASIALTTSGSVYDKKCSRCGEKVAMAPSGQRFYKEHPDAVIVCAGCITPEDLHEAEQRTASPDELRQEFANIQPNTWKDRN